jgi:hypothetical protein
LNPPVWFNGVTVRARVMSPADNPPSTQFVDDVKSTAAGALREPSCIL